jgi:hypothetical protein
MLKQAWQWCSTYRGCEVASPLQATEFEMGTLTYEQRVSRRYKIPSQLHSLNENNLQFNRIQLLVVIINLTLLG